MREREGEKKRREKKKGRERVKRLKVDIIEKKETEVI